jgi:hypothetical protein
MTDASPRPPSRWDHPALGPLLRGLGTTVLVFASLLVGVAEHQQAEQARAVLERSQHRIEAEVEAAQEGAGVDALTREVGLLRRQLAESSIASEVIANPHFQLLGLLGTLLVALSFFVEAWQRRQPQPRSQA